MKCPRNLFVDLNYGGDIEKQKQEICKVCKDYNGGAWGEHCDASLKCIKCGKTLEQSIFGKIDKFARSHATHSVCDNCRKIINQIIDEQRKKLGRRPW